jgi:hypothetical protein
VIDRDVCSSTSRRELTPTLSKPGDPLLALQGVVVIVGRSKVGPANNSVYVTGNIAWTHNWVKTSSGQWTMRYDPETVHQDAFPIKKSGEFDSHVFCEFG